MFSRRHEWILGCASPGDETNSCSWRRCAAQVREGLDGDVEEHHAEAGNEEIEARTVEGMGLSVCANIGDGDVLEARALSCSGDHRLRDVHAGTRAAPSEAVRQCDRGAARPAADIQHVVGLQLIRSVGRHGLRRLFDPSVLERLALIGLGRAAGFSLDEIGAMLTADGRQRIDRAK